MDTSKHLQAIADSMMGTASSIAVKHELTPTLIIQVVDQPVLMPLGREPLAMDDDSSRERTFRILSGLVCTLQPTATGFAHEVWLSEVDPEAPDLSTPISERPGCKEAIMVVAQSKDATLVLSREIIRREGQPTELCEVRKASRTMVFNLYKVEPMTQDEAEIVGFMADSIKQAIAADARGEGPPN